MTEQIPETLTGLVVDIDTLILYPGNARRGDVPAIAESLRVHGQYRPIVVQESTGYVLAGNHTLAAARQLGWTQIAATFVDVDDDRAKKIVLVDNRSNDLAHYDNTELLELLQSLPDTSGTGYDDDALAALLADALRNQDADPADAPGDVEASDDTQRQSLAFHLTQEQADALDAAIESAKGYTGAKFGTNGAALVYICEAYE